MIFGCKVDQGRGEVEGVVLGSLSGAFTSNLSKSYRFQGILIHTVCVSSSNEVEGAQ